MFKIEIHIVLLRLDSMISDSCHFANFPSVMPLVSEQILVVYEIDTPNIEHNTKFNLKLVSISIVHCTIASVSFK